MAEYDHFSSTAEAARRFSDNLENQDMACAVKELQKFFDELDSVLLNIAITGESGVGKSSFVNAFRGVGDDDEEKSAPTGVVETTMEPKAYTHPKNSSVIFWDLPGIGTPNFKADEYLKKVNFEQYDFFIIITSDRFKSSSVDLAKEIQRMRKQFYFVRSKIDDNIRAERRKRNFNQENVLNQIRQDCIKGLERSGVESAKVFLISSHELGKYDFNLLQDTIDAELPMHKRNTLLLALPNATMKIHQKKKEALQARTWKLALLSAGIAAIPVPGLSICADLTILVSEIKRYYQAFDLNDEALKNLSRQTGVSFEEFKACLQSPLNEEISQNVVLKMLSSIAGAGTSIMLIEEAVSFIPFIGSVAAAAMSFTVTKHMLDRCLEELANDAQRVLQKALQTPV